LRLQIKAIKAIKAPTDAKRRRVWYIEIAMGSPVMISTGWTRLTESTWSVPVSPQSQEDAVAFDPERAFSEAEVNVPDKS
jgi:hypothetical protein